MIEPIPARRVNQQNTAAFEHICRRPQSRERKIDMLDHIPQGDNIKTSMIFLPIISFNGPFDDIQSVFGFGVVRSSVAKFNTGSNCAVLIQFRQEQTSSATNIQNL